MEARWPWLVRAFFGERENGGREEHIRNARTSLHVVSENVKGYAVQAHTYGAYTTVTFRPISSECYLNRNGY
jgi:hypothetical protein